MEEQPATFTPGPWSITKTSRSPLLSRYEIEADAATRPVHVAFLDVAGLSVDAENICLIAAAPDLYEALRGLLAPEPGGVYATNDLIQAARKAIAKAEGR